MSPGPHLRDAFDALDEPVLIVRGARTTFANTAARQLLGAAIEGRDVRFALRHPRALDAIQMGQSIDLPLVGLAGPEQPWTLSVRPLRDGHILLRLVDRSDSVAAERMRVDFVANASHELRTPLATIAGYAETLAEDEPVQDQHRRRFARTIAAEAARMLRIIEDLMSLSRIEANRFNLPREVVDLAVIAATAVEHGRPHAERRSSEIRLTVAPDCRVRGDRAQLLQVADNLIGNALRYGRSPAGEPIEVIVERRRDQVRLRVVDHGEGVAAEHLPRLTERFYRVDAARSREGGGTGLGLAIVKHIVERHRGTLEITSAVGRGTTVEISLPLVR